MQLTHHFTVPGPVDQTWVRFQDIADVAQCFPGAQVTSAEGNTFEGTVKVKLGPIALVYAGSGTFTEKDEAAHRFVVEAKGRDKRGNGTAAATVTLTMAPSTSADSSTDVEIVTDLAITGKPAQFGRGVMQDVSDKLLGQFVACLEKQSSASPASSVPQPAADPDSGPASVPAGAAAATADAADPDAGPASVPAGAAAESAPDPVVEEVAQQPSRDLGGASGGFETGASAPSSTTGGTSSSTSGGGSAPEAIDLGATVLPALARAYWKPAVAGVLGLAAVFATVRRFIR